MTGDETERRARSDWTALGRALRERGVLTADWAPSFEAVPRAGFLPEVMWPYDMGSRTSAVCDRNADPARWYAAAATNVPITTQWDDGRHTGTAPGRIPTSSSSMPSVVMEMLAALDVRDGHRVLEIGTGTGWNAALLTHRLGGDRVVTVEVDATVAASARAALDRAGRHPTVLTGDGLLGHPGQGPYDRTVITAGLRQVPYALVEQTVPGGLIVMPWGSSLTTADRLVRLVVAEDGRTACGHLTTPVEFMKARSQRVQVDQGAYLPDGFPGGATASSTGLTSAEAGFEEPWSHPFMTVAGLLVPDCVLLRDRRGDTVSVWLYGLTDRSWAAALLTDGVPRSTVHQSGPRHLWDELTGAHRWWTGHGSPSAERFGITVTPEGGTAWLDDPARTV
ncbi:protein-L-isoaspartate(D-aspartate) O-methyltransferase [Streptomyces uncialis]|uniref:protein-L-isoaspartate(D-aspartate) O-methyltransferase n=1 Tax=Streptomyces uncialis TaxID=1048205 RepID=UPI002255BC14|nr:protein-L-isoaspartate(D-aspartate) O-methyltransferase [Streptomyces uncialis]MCX4664503.1 protein-L-isoaspartate(D-aspartate) O-methyltransferase [Streptomyces uncialis]